MADSGSRRMILRRLDPKADDSTVVADRVAATPGVDVLNHPSPSALLVDGSAAAIEAVVSGSSGWTAIPVTTFEHPDAMPRVRNPPD